MLFAKRAAEVYKLIRLEIGIVIDGLDNNVHAMFYQIRLRAMFLIHNERTKLTAAWLNTVATALMAAGAFAPMAAWLYGISAVPVGVSYFAVIAFTCVLAGGGLHVLALALLRRLRQ
jgi:hypothetical protein